MCTVDSIFGIVIFHICMSLFESTFFSFCIPQSKLDPPTLRHGFRERKNTTEQIRNMTLTRISTQAHLFAKTQQCLFK